MARINLLPWREEYRQEKKKEFITQLVGFCVLAGLVSWLWVMNVDGSIEYQVERNNILRAEIKQLESQVQEIQELKKRRKELQDRMRVIQDLQGKRPVIVRYFDEFAKAVPDGVYMMSLRRVGNTLTIEGVSESNNRVSTFMRNLDDSEFFQAPDLKSVVAAPDQGEQSSRFVMELQLVLPGENNGET